MKNNLIQIAAFSLATISRGGSEGAGAEPRPYSFITATMASARIGTVALFSPAMFMRLSPIM